MSLQPKPSLSLDEWIEQERNALEARCEYVHGEVFAMTGASADHNSIVMNIGRELSTQMKGKPCQVYANDMKVVIRAADAGKYPDILAYCGPPEFSDGRRDVLLNPSLIVEVLSPSTEAYDRGDKFALYRQIPSLRQYLLVSQDRARVELYERGEAGRWILTEYAALTDEVVLSSVGCTLPLSEIYDKVEFLRS
ncbi:Uma2 family endonuclease [Thiorhodococcus mannitoliphagus]|uniref:Uma2 family endonuclease n=1 Tax=Thiorhodococcus mannitoliphagus TaxID=329406 RepID=A0A6P1E425_9GAMM|nr:Uma2 family endonuclease [Thiorhodococcus mannitoliphagus]NEX23823.1 Uma2 family endonuclease [Thiorhodococcus mannitoliphagus]